MGVIGRFDCYSHLTSDACEFVAIKTALGYTEMDARHELAMGLGAQSTSHGGDLCVCTTTFLKSFIDKHCSRV